MDRCMDREVLKAQLNIHYMLNIYIYGICYHYIIIIWNCLPSDNVDFFQSLHLSTHTNVSTSVISSTLHTGSFLRTGIVSVTFVLLKLFYLFFFLWRLLVLYFSLVAPAICYLFFLHVVLYVFLANK